MAVLPEAEDIDIEVAAKLAEMSLDEFKSLNASFNRPIILAEHNPVLLLPTNRVDIFNANLEAYKGRLSSWQTYRSKKGESYASIAKQHGITLGQLRSVNGLSSRQTRAVAQTLLVPAAGTAGGMHHVCDATRQIMGRADRAQVTDCHRAFVSGNGGILSEQTTLILEGD